MKDRYSEKQVLGYVLTVSVTTVEYTKSSIHLVKNLKVGDEREVEVLRNFNWPPSELITEDGVLPERGYSQFNDVSSGYLVAQPQINPNSMIARVEQITSFKWSETGGPATLEQVASCIVGREAYCSTGFEGRIIGCKLNPTSVE
ncbi:hypothetical protein Tco_0962775 [Tanacetum coccineum]